MSDAMGALADIWAAPVMGMVDDKYFVDRGGAPSEKAFMEPSAF